MPFESTRHPERPGTVSSTRLLPAAGPVKITVRKVSGSEVQATVSADTRISGDLEQFVARDPGPEHEGAEDSSHGLGGQELLTVEQAAEVLHINRDHVYGVIRTGKLRSIKIGKLRRSSRQRIADFIRQRET